MARNKKEVSTKPKRAYNKFHNIKFVDEDGIKWDSQWEYDVWQILKILREEGKIYDLQRQQKFKLHSPHVNDDCSITLTLICTWAADYTFYLADGTFVIADAKSTRTAKQPDFRIKVKMAAAEYGFPIKLFVKGEIVTLDLTPVKRKRKVKK